MNNLIEKYFLIILTFIYSEINHKIYRLIDSIPLQQKQILYIIRIYFLNNFFINYNNLIIYYLKILSLI
jgi:hypothetical protein